LTPDRVEAELSRVEVGLRADPSRVNEVLHNAVNHNIPSGKSAVYIQTERKVREVERIMTGIAMVEGEGF
jgi:hypothetical protein